MKGLASGIGVTATVRSTSCQTASNSASDIISINSGIRLAMISKRNQRHAMGIRGFFPCPFRSRRRNPSSMPQTNCPSSWERGPIPRPVRHAASRRRGSTAAISGRCEICRVRKIRSAPGLRTARSFAAAKVLRMAPMNSSLAEDPPLCHSARGPVDDRRANPSTRLPRAGSRSSDASHVTAPWRADRQAAPAGLALGPDARNACARLAAAVMKAA